MNSGLLKMAAILAVAIGVAVPSGAVWAASDETGEPEGVAATGEAPADVPSAQPKNVYLDWLESNHVLGMGDTECHMCAGFGGGFLCGLGCDATGLTIIKQDGYVHPICGTCNAGTWE